MTSRSLAWLCIALGCARSSPNPEAPRHTLVATVHQFGPVGYRDPLGVLSPDGRRLATATHNQLRIHAVPETIAAVQVFLAGDARILQLAWLDNRRLVMAQRRMGVTWWLYDLDSAVRRPLWSPGTTLRDSAGASVPADALRELSWSGDGHRIAGIELTPGGSRLWIVDSAGATLATRTSTLRLGFPAWLPDGSIVCLAFAAERQRVTLPCGAETPPELESKATYGPLAVSPDGGELYLAVPNDSGFLGLWAWTRSSRSVRRLVEFRRDTYAPSVTADGSVLFKDQDYHTEVLVLPASGGRATRRTAFQAETPSWDPSGTRLGITYGTWRRVMDDFRYPDIAQEAGVVAAAGAAPATGPDQVVQSSPSEDQGLSWSPNGRWIAFHSHQQGSDDIWLRPADRPDPLTRISTLGRGAEVGWPRWSPNGRWIVFDGDSGSGSRPWIVGVDQATGRVTQATRPVPLTGFQDNVIHAEWLGSSEELVFSATAPSGVHTLYRVARTGGSPRPIHSYTSTQIVDGFGVSPDGSWLVFPQPDANGRLQLFRVDTAAGARPKQLTSDSTDKTQPAVSPDGRRIAFTAWRYDVRFWLLAK